MKVNGLASLTGAQTKTPGHTLLGCTTHLLQSALQASFASFCNCTPPIVFAFHGAQVRLHDYAAMFNVPEIKKKVKLLKDHPVCYKNMARLAMAGWEKQKPGPKAAAAAAAGAGSAGSVFIETQVSKISCDTTT